MVLVRGKPATVISRFGIPGNRGDILRNVQGTGETAINGNAGVVAIKLIDLAGSSVDAGTGTISVGTPFGTQTFTVAFNTDAATTADDIVTALEANVKVNSIVDVSANAGVVTLAGKSPAQIGNNFLLTVTGYTAASSPVDPVVEDGTGASQVASNGTAIPVGRMAIWATGTLPKEAALPTSAGQAQSGVIVRESDYETTFTSEDRQVPAGKPVAIAQKGEFVVEVENATIAPFATAFFRHTVTGSEKAGVFTTTDDGDTDPINLGTARFVAFDERNSSATNVVFNDQDGNQVAVLQIL